MVNKATAAQTKSTMELPNPMATVKTRSSPVTLFIYRLTARTTQLNIHRLPIK